MAAKEYQFKVSRFEEITPTVFEVGLERPESFSFEAGQFVSVVVPGVGPGGRDLRRAYSIASGPEETEIVLCVKLVEGGPGTNYLFKLRPGHFMRGLAPYGHFVYETRPERQAVMISTGTGIAPFRSMLKSHQFQSAPPQKAYLMLGVRTEDELLYSDEIQPILGEQWIQAVSQPRDLEWEKRGPARFKGRVTDILRQWGQTGFDWGASDFYLCGNGAMITETLQILAGHGVTKEAIFKEKYF